MRLSQKYAVFTATSITKRVKFVDITATQDWRETNVPWSVCILIPTVDPSWHPLQRAAFSSCRTRLFRHSQVTLYLPKERRLSQKYAVFTATSITKRVKFVDITATQDWCETNVPWSVCILIPTVDPSWHPLQRAAFSSCRTRLFRHSQITLYLPKERRLSQKYAVFTATSITKRVKFVDITATQDWRETNVPWSVCILIPTVDPSWHPLQRAAFSSCRTRLFRHSQITLYLPKERRLSQKYAVFTAASITKRVKFVDITATQDWHETNVPWSISMHVPIEERDSLFYFLRPVMIYISMKCKCILFMQNQALSWLCRCALNGLSPSQRKSGSVKEVNC